ncbi:MAG: PQQ-dependent sugar dehydrogenase [Fimbriimonadaceae bacterium]|nr:PQQ-dependent sugar dehydrogenase [Fimbriimonadaceae bacterium]QYK55574.1 MAG: PQQ-dependent sugar dehydrogenase [Fimbriimonadaceae bacterium]
MKRLLALAIFAVATVPSLAQNLTATPYVSGFSSSVGIIQDPVDPSLQYVIQQGGTIFVVQDGVRLPTPFLTLSVLVGSERGLLGLAFPPDYATSGTFYVNYTSNTSPVYMQLSRFQLKAGTRLEADPASQVKVLRTQRPFTNHNAGTIQFGPDGYLYVPTGDGGSANDPGNRAQNPNELLGKMLRLDVSGDDFPADPERNYAIPPDNPFVDNDPIAALDEIWAFGYRNPWKFSFDDPNLLGTGAMVVGDVGQSAWEEIDYEPAGQGGRNYGWRVWEGSQMINGGALAYGPDTKPIFAYNRSVGQSITGGYVYRGLELGPDFFGRYVYADYVAGRLFSLRLVIDPVTGEATATDNRNHSSEVGSIGNISSINPDENGELYTVALGGTVYKLGRQNVTHLTDASRQEGVFLSGQLRSLVIADGKELEIVPFAPGARNTKVTRMTAGFKTNVANRNTVTVEFLGRANQSIPVGTVVSLRNWQTGQFDAVATGNITGTPTPLTGTGSAADYVRSSDGRIEVQVATSYSGILTRAFYSNLYDRIEVRVQ